VREKLGKTPPPKKKQVKRRRRYPRLTRCGGGVGVGGGGGVGVRSVNNSSFTNG